MFGFLRLLTCLALSAILLLPGYAGCENIESENVFARQRQTLASVKKSFKPLEDKSNSRLLFTPVKINPESTVTVISPVTWRELANRVKSATIATHTRFEQLLGQTTPIKATIRLLDETSFFKKTGAPAWTNAMYYHGEILIPISNYEQVDFDNVKRSIRHEYAHAVIHSLSNGKCPGWLDEGIAQWLEGVENPALQPALLSWLHTNPPVDLKLLQGGFTKLNEEMVPAAYAQSLFAATTLIQGYGLPAVRRYFDLLRQGHSREYAFTGGFNVHEALFEAAMGKKLISWRDSFSSNHQVSNK